MNPKSTIISYSKVNPLGQLIIGLDDGTIFNSGSVFGPTGKQGPVGEPGPVGPTGPSGAGIASLRAVDGHLQYTLENNHQLYYDAGQLPYLEGPTGKNGASIVNFKIEHDNILTATTSDYKNIIAGKINTLSGPTGPPGQMGPSGAPFTLSNMYIDDQHQLTVTDDKNKTYKCGYAGGCTGPTGPAGVWDNAFTDKNGHLILIHKNKFIDAGYIVGPTGPPCQQSQEVQLLREEVKVLRNRVAALETKCAISRD